MGVYGHEEVVKTRATVAVPVTNLRKKPVGSPCTTGRDGLQESQLLYNEMLLVIDETEDWLQVEATAQRKFLGPEGWGGYPGWVRKKDVAPAEAFSGHNGSVKSACATIAADPSPKAPVLFQVSLGTRFFIMGEAEGFLEVSLPEEKVGWVRSRDVAKRGTRSAGHPPAEDLVSLACLFLGVPYLWGGCSMPLPGSAIAMGVDCSGLINLVFRACNVDVPRDAHDQWLAADRIAPGDLRAGDLIFLSLEDRPDSIDHVMLSLGGERFIEAPQTGDAVRIRSFSDKLGLNLRRLERQDCTVNNRRVYFGRVKSGQEI
jgi:gamma-D-glutamyl-L-lysine dipeptidyl-peptidase